ncbi:MAG: acetate--CoA ligase family protein [Candidatus Heimdallarchaeota archaeon]|nr:acetate--CoA ligase family protein [Candidatus Heimdallarchaeota archaeon]
MTTDKKSLFETAYKEGRNFLLEYEALQIFEAAGVIFPPNKLTKEVDEAVAFAKKIGYPIVIKAMSPQILHKSDFKAVEIGITDEGALKAKYEAMKARLQKFALNGILVEKQVKKGIELFIGMNIDPTFGSVIAFGIGGTLIEAIRDVTFRLCPTTKERAQRMIDEIKTQKMLNGFRGLPPVDRDALAEMIVNVSKIADKYNNYIKEIDLNPVIANEDGIFGVDARIILKAKD